MGRRSGSRPGTVTTAVLAACALGATVGCGSDDDDGSAADTTSTTAEATTTTAAVDAQTVDIGEGKELYLECQGEGSPMIILEAGDESGHEDWSQVDRELGEATSTCSYDRLGTGRSSEATGAAASTTSSVIRRRCITTAELEGPYVFVGASGGGYLAAEMAEPARRRDRRGWCWSRPPRRSARSRPTSHPLLACDAPTNVERRDYVAVEHDGVGRQAPDR